MKDKKVKLASPRGFETIEKTREYYDEDNKFRSVKQKYYVIQMGMLWGLVICAMVISGFIGRTTNNDDIDLLNSQLNEAISAKWTAIGEVDKCEEELKEFENICFERQMEIINSCIYEESVTTLVKKIQQAEEAKNE